MATRRCAHYTVRVADQICEEIALGRTLEAAIKKVGYLAPNIQTCWRWFDIYPEFREKYDRARQLQADMHADKMLQMAEDILDTGDSRPSAKRVVADILKWQAEIRNRERYGKKGEDASKSKPMDATKLRQEIKRLENELGIVEAKVVPIKVVKK